MGLTIAIGLTAFIVGFIVGATYVRLKWVKERYQLSRLLDLMCARFLHDDSPTRIVQYLKKEVITDLQDPSK